MKSKDSLGRHVNLRIYKNPGHLNAKFIPFVRSVRPLEIVGFSGHAISYLLVNTQISASIDDNFCYFQQLFLLALQKHSLIFRPL
jgi:hypothetical protein